jgi:hypothetical protein
LSEECEERKSANRQDGESKGEKASIGLRGRLDFDANVGHLIGSQKSCGCGLAWLVQVCNGNYQSAVLATGLIYALLVTLSKGVLKLSFNCIASLREATSKVLSEAEVWGSDLNILEIWDTSNHHINVCLIDHNLGIPAVRDNCICARFTELQSIYLELSHIPEGVQI